MIRRHWTEETGKNGKVGVGVGLGDEIRGEEEPREYGECFHHADVKRGSDRGSWCSWIYTSSNVNVIEIFTEGGVALN